MTGIKRPKASEPGPYDIKRMRVPKSTEPGFYQEWHRKLRPEGSTKNLGPHHIRLTVTIRRRILQMLEAMAYWEFQRRIDAGERADERITASSIAAEILEKHFKNNPVKNLPDEECFDRVFALQKKVYKKNYRKWLKEKNQAKK